MIEREFVEGLCVTYQKYKKCEVIPVRLLSLHVMIEGVTWELFLSDVRLEC
jgi:hypothetical protein